jgi:hypothetical protein
MTADDTRSIVQAYHDAWTSKHFDQAIGLLSAKLEVEVPINDYPTTQSFAQALAGFGGLATRVELIAEFSAAGEAMLLYDVDVERLGRLRIAEHFTVADGRIVRIRQVHDTVALRAAGFEQPQSSS